MSLDDWTTRYEVACPVCRIAADGRHIVHLWVDPRTGAIVKLRHGDSERAEIGGGGDAILSLLGEDSVQDRLFGASLLAHLLVELHGLETDEAGK